MQVQRHQAWLFIADVTDLQGQVKAFLEGLATAQLEKALPCIRDKGRHLHPLWRCH